MCYLPPPRPSRRREVHQKTGGYEVIVGTRANCAAATMQFSRIRLRQDQSSVHRSVPADPERRARIGVYADEWHCGSGLCSTLMVNLLKKNTRAPPEGSACLICGIRQFVSLSLSLFSHSSRIIPVEIRSFESVGCGAAVPFIPRNFSPVYFPRVHASRYRAQRARNCTFKSLSLSSSLPPSFLSLKFRRNGTY